MDRTYHQPVVLHPDRLLTAVGVCGANQVSEVKKLQRMVVDAGYRLATGRRLAVDGICGQQTVEAIRWYQRLLHLSPSGLVTPVSVYFMSALNAMSPANQPREAGGLLRVSAGQFTFDNEGQDYLTAAVPYRAVPARWFSRVLHWPGGVSGVTLGRGFDMKQRSAGEIYSILRRAGLEEHKATICSRAAGLSGRTAQQFVTVFGPLVGEMTHRQQIELFELVYPGYVSLAKHYYLRHTKKLQIVQEAVSWEAMDTKIKDVYVDIVYQGVDDIKTLTRAAAKNKRDKMIALIEQSNLYMKYEKQRKRICHLL